MVLVLSTTARSEPSLEVVVAAASSVPSESLQPQLLRSLLLRRCPAPWPSGPIESLSTSSGLLGVRTGAGIFVVDWQQLRTHPLPNGWLPLAIAPQLILLL